MMGFDGMERYTSTISDVCILNCSDESEWLLNEERPAKTDLVAANDEHASVHLVYEHTAFHNGQDNQTIPDVADMHGRNV